MRPRLKQNYQTSLQPVMKRPASSKKAKASAFKRPTANALQKKTIQLEAAEAAPSQLLRRNMGTYTTKNIQLTSQSFMVTFKVVEELKAGKLVEDFAKQWAEEQVSKATSA